MACGALPQVTVNAGETTTVAACFTDPNGDSLVYSAASSDSGVARVSASGTTVRVEAVAQGAATVPVTATDPEDASVSQVCQVEVLARSTEWRENFDSAGALDDWEIYWLE